MNLRELYNRRKGRLINARLYLLPFPVHVRGGAATERRVDIVRHQEAVRTVRVLVISATGGQHEARGWRW